MDKEQRSAASNFQKSVQTSTITVGEAPPSNGNALTWASSVQESPVLISYSLLVTHNLFTERYSKHLSEVNIDKCKREADKRIQDLLPGSERRGTGRFV